MLSAKNVQVHIPDSNAEVSINIQLFSLFLQRIIYYICALFNDKQMFSIILYVFCCV